MPEIINCPQCERKLRVPENLLGQAVKCPTCGVTFTATASTAAPEPPAFAPPPFEAPPPPPMPSAPPPMPSSGPPPLPPQGELERRYPDLAPQGELPPYRDPGFQGGSAGYDDDFEARRRAQRQEARRSVEGPATALMVYSILTIAAHVCSVGVNLTQGAALGPGFGPPGRGVVGADSIMLVGVALGGGLLMVLDILVLIGSQKMKGLESYGMSMAACIVAMLPCSLCCVLGLPFGIWGLVALNQPGVKESFRG